MARHFEPRHAQVLMRDFALEHNRCNLWATPGVGKTGAVLILFELLRVLGSSFFPVLVIAPPEVADAVWPGEVAKWHEFRDLRIVNLAGGKSPRERARLLNQDADIFVINYELVQWLCEQFGDGKWPFKAVVADESTKLRNFRLRHGGKRSTALAKISKHVGRWINLTGGPQPKDMIDLWGQMWFIDRGQRLGRTFGEFERTYFDYDEYSRKHTLKPGARDTILSKIRDVTLTLRAEDYYDLPPLTVTDHRVKLSDNTMRVYAEMERELYVELRGLPIEAANRAVGSSKCMQVCSGAIYTNAELNQYEVLDDAKLEVIANIYNESDGPVLVAYHWQSDLTRLQERFPQGQAVKGKDQYDRWNAGLIDLGFVQPESIGHGIDLAIGGNILVFMSNWWNFDPYMQVIERIGPTRQFQHGLNRPVFVHRIIAEGTMDERCIARLEERRADQDYTMDYMKR